MVSSHRMVVSLGTSGCNQTCVWMISAEAINLQLRWSHRKTEKACQSPTIELSHLISRKMI